MPDQNNIWTKPELTYAGIGSRDTPLVVQNQMRSFARSLASWGWILHSGGAVGADQAFASGAGEAACIFTASNAHEQPGFAGAERIAEEHHPAWHRLSPYVRRLHARNVFQVLGPDLHSPVRFVLCWTPDGAYRGRETGMKTGGTGQALRIADAYGIPIYNLKNWGKKPLFRQFFHNHIALWTPGKIGPNFL